MIQFMMLKLKVIAKIQFLSRYVSNENIIEFFNNVDSFMTLLVGLVILFAPWN